MVTSLSMRSNQTSKNTTQEELRVLLGKSPAAHRFLTLFGTPLEDFVGNILEIFKRSVAPPVGPWCPMIPEPRTPTVSGAGLPARFLPASAIASPA
jgi:hypothetical protein